MSITQKLHGSNGCIYWDGTTLLAGSRSRWLKPGKGTDNFGFAQFVEERADQIKELLGLGTHYGEWVGQGINTGEGLEERRFCLFNWRRHSDSPLPDRFSRVPVLYTGAFCLAKIEEVMTELKEKGSRLVPGYMKPEGIVIEVNRVLYKKVFDESETNWAKKERVEGEPIGQVDVSHLLQPLRLEKLLSRDEQYVLNYPHSLKDIVAAYVVDLKSEHVGLDKSVSKALGGVLFKFVRESMEKRNGMG